MYTTQKLSEYIHDFRLDDMSGQARSAAIRCVLDLLTATLTGIALPGVEAVRRVVRNHYRSGPTAIWFTGQTSSVLGAVFSNTAAATALDLDDGYRPARGHPGAAVIPAAIAAAAETNAAADELLAAVVIGYETSLRIATARVLHSSSGTWSGYGAIAAAGWLRRTPPAQMAHALAIAAITAPILKGPTRFSDLSGSDVKEGIPRAVVTGLDALYLAEEGFTGSGEILDHPAHFDRDRMITGGGRPNRICDVYFKAYSCCRHLHAPIDAFRRLMEHHRLGVADITAVEVHTYAATFDLTNYTDPATLTDVQFSVPYCIGIAAVLGTEALLPLEKAVLDNPEIRAVARKVTLHRDPHIDRHFPGETRARVTILTGGGRFESPLTTPRGEAGNPLTWAELCNKLVTATHKLLTPEHQQNLLYSIDRLNEGDNGPLFKIIRKPVVSH